MNYRFTGKQKTLALGVYPAVSLLKARQRRDKARELLADGIDPSTAKRADKQAKADAAAHTFEMVARDWLAKTAAERMATTQDTLTSWLEKDVIPVIGKMPCGEGRERPGLQPHGPLASPARDDADLGGLPGQTSPWCERDPASQSLNVKQFYASPRYRPINRVTLAFFAGAK
jgi:hypothetical protein